MSTCYLSCSNKKLPVPAPAWLLYSRSQRFSQAYQWAKSRFDRIFILSAKHGVVPEAQVLEPYDASLDKMSREDRLLWGAKCRESIELYSTVIVNLEYRRYIGEIDVEWICESMFGQSQTFGRVGKLRRGRILHGWPVGDILTYVFDEKPTLEQLRRFIDAKWDNPKTQDAQWFRALNCPLHCQVNGRIYNTYHKNPREQLLWL